MTQYSKPVEILVNASGVTLVTGAAFSGHFGVCWQLAWPVVMF